MSNLSTADVAKLLGVEVWRIRRLCELGLYDPPMVAGRRLVPSTDLPTIVDLLRDRGWLPSESAKEAE